MSTLPLSPCRRLRQVNDFLLECTDDPGPANESSSINVGGGGGSAGGGHSNMYSREEAEDFFRTSSESSSGNSSDSSSACSDSVDGHGTGGVIAQGGEARRRNVSRTAKSRSRQRKTHTQKQRLPPLPPKLRSLAREDQRWDR